MKTIFYKVLKWVTRKAPLILSGAGALGVLGTGFCSAKGSPKAVKAIEEAEEEKGEELTRWEKVKVGSKPFIPAFIIGAFAVASIFGSYILGERQIKALAASCAATAAAFTKYKEAVKETVGEETEKEISKKVFQSEKTPEINQTSIDDEKVWIFEPINETYFISTKNKIKEAFYELNKRMRYRGYIDIRDYALALGLDPRHYYEFGDLVIDPEYLSLMNGGIDWLEPSLFIVKGPEGHELETAYRLECDIPFAIPEESFNGRVEYIPIDSSTFRKNNCLGGTCEIY